MKFYKSFLFLFGLNFLFVLPVWLFLDLRYLVPVFVFLLILNLFLLFSAGFYLKRNFSFSAFVPEDPYGVHSIFEDLKNTYNLRDIQLLKIKHKDCSFFCFCTGKKSFVILSEDLLESFSKRDIKLLLSYPFQMAKSGDLFFLTLLSGFLFLMEKLLYFSNYPLSFFKKDLAKKKENLFLFLVLGALSLMTRNIFYKVDKNVFLREQRGKEQALFLWRLDSVFTVNPPKVFPFMAPLFLTNPLTDLIWQGYISLQPLIKERIKRLTGVYPP